MSSSSSRQQAAKHVEAWGEAERDLLRNIQKEKGNERAWGGHTERVFLDNYYCVRTMTNGDNADGSYKGEIQSKRR